MFKREGTYICLWLIHVDVWQKSRQYCKAILFQLKISKFKSIYVWDLGKEESTGLEVAICQALCQALNIFSHCFLMNTVPNCYKTPLLRKANWGSKSVINSPIVTETRVYYPINTPWFPGRPLHCSKEISSTVNQSHSRVLGFLLPSEGRD